MKRFGLTWALLASLLTGCAMVDPGPKVPHIDVLRVKLVKDAAGTQRVVLDPPVFLIESGSKFGDGLIVWRLEKGAGLSFDGMRGIFIDGEVQEATQIEPLSRLTGKDTGNDNPKILRRLQNIDPQQKEIGPCTVGPDHLTYTCVNKRSRPGHFKYTVRVHDATNQFILDPDGWNW
jgi:hypothetical protein